MACRHLTAFKKAIHFPGMRSYCLKVESLKERMAAAPKWSEHTHKDRVHLDFRTLSKSQTYDILCAAIVPRPIAFVSTTDKNGVKNLATFSFFMPVTSDPPTLAFSVTRKKYDRKKDTLNNIEATGHFVVNHTSLPFMDKAFNAAFEFPSEVDEFSEVGLTPVNCLHGPAPYVLESPLALECTLYKTLEVGSGSYGSATLVVGEIIHAYASSASFKAVNTSQSSTQLASHKKELHDDALQIGEEDVLSLEGLESVSRLGGMLYGNAVPNIAIFQDQVWGKAHW